MGFNEDYQWVAYRHTDAEHEHIHIIASRINLVDGHAQNQKHDYYRSQEVIRLLENEFGLKQVQSSWQQQQKTEANPKLAKPETQEKHTNIEQTKAFLRSAIAFETRDRPSFSKLVNRLDDQGIRVGIKRTRSGKIQGISYEMDGVAVRGSRMGSDYTWNGIQNHLGVSVDPGRDNNVLNQAAVQYQEMSTGATDKQKTRRKYRQKYREYSVKAVGAAKVAYDGQYTQKTIDEGVAFLAQRDLGKDEAAMVLFHSDQVRQWEEGEEDKDKLINLASKYIRSVLDEEVPRERDRQKEIDLEL